jgi:hypothetical protein
MDESSPVKDLLYQTLEAIPQNDIHKRISSDTKSLIKEIFSKSGIDTLDGNKTENYEKFAESLMHYLLTNALIPSQRKILVDQIELDVVIPDIRTLKASNKDAIVLVFPKSEDVKSIRQRLENIHKIQPIQENIWLVQKLSLDLAYKTYEIDKTKTFFGILDDIRNKTAGKTQSKFKIFKV